MGIKGLMKLIGDRASGSVREYEMKNLFGRKVAIDASMSLYQFLIAIRQGVNQEQLTNDAGEVTSHLNGLWYRTLRMMDHGLKPVYVFDGKPPSMKGGELAKRKEAREKAAAELKDAQEREDQEDINKYKSRLVRVSPEHNEEAKKLLRLMGVPVVQAVCEAEATCAALASAGKVYAAASEDMDTLTFGATRLLRHLTHSAARKSPIVEITHSTMLEELGMSQKEFIQMCILCGCDYTSSIRGIGPKRAHELIKKHGTIEEMIKHLDSTKYPVPEDFQHKEAAVLFESPEVTDPATVELEWKAPDEEGLIQFMCTEKGFSEDRIRSGIAKLKASRKKGTQKRLTSFFQSAPKPKSSSSSSSSSAKRKAGSQKGKPKKGRVAGKKK